MYFYLTINNDPFFSSTSTSLDDAYNKDINKKELNEYIRDIKGEIKSHNEYFSQYKIEGDIDGKLLDDEIERMGGSWPYVTKYVLNSIDYLLEYMPEDFEIDEWWYDHIDELDDLIDGSFFILLDENKEEIPYDMDKSLDKYNSFFVIKEDE